MRLLNDDIDMPVEDMYNLADILHNSDVLLTEYSTLMIEGAVFDLPIINVAMYNYRDTDKPASYFETYTHVNRILKIGACKNAYTIEQLIGYINDALSNPDINEKERKRLVRQEITTNKGLAGESIGLHISTLL